MKRMNVIASVLMVLVMSVNAQAEVIINEILADPAKELAGDANADGVRSASQDEFVELYNSGDKPVNVSAWTVRDSKKVRHVFPENTMINKGEYLVVFGGSKEELREGNWQKASSGSLGLDNSGDLIMLLDGEENIIDRVEYKSIASKDQSIVRSPQEDGGEFILHTEDARSGGALFSPGKTTSEATVKNAKK